MTHDPLDRFVKQNLREPPPAPANEWSQIWGRVEALPGIWDSFWGRLAVAASPVAACLLVAMLNMGLWRLPTDSESRMADLVQKFYADDVKLGSDAKPDGESLPEMVFAEPFAEL